MKVLRRLNNIIHKNKENTLIENYFRYRILNW